MTLTPLCGSCTTRHSTRISVGDVLCSAIAPVPVSNRFVAQISTFGTLVIPFIRGSQVQLHIQHLEVPANVSKLVGLLDRSGKVQKAKPRAVGPMRMAVVEVTTEKPIPMETQKDCRNMGRFVLRQRGKTVAAGHITEIPAAGGAKKKGQAKA